MQVGNLVKYKRHFGALCNKVGTIIALRPLFDYDERPYWAEVRWTENIHQEITCKVDNLTVISQ